mgnify:CR=1 FL=1
MEELGFYKDQTEYYKRSIEDLLHHYTDSCGMCTANLDCSTPGSADFHALWMILSISYEIFCIVVVNIKEKTYEAAFTV